MKKVLCFITLLLITGCAVQSPMSEMLMFREKEDYEGKMYKSRYSHSILGFTANLYSPHAINEYAQKKRAGSGETSYNYTTRATVMTQAIFISDESNTLAASLGIGNAIGVDVTAKLMDEVYISGALNWAQDLPQGEIVLQKRILDGNPTGLSLGIIYQRNYQYVDIDGVSCGLCFPSEAFYTNSIGIRTVVLLAPSALYGKSKPFLHLTGSMNYDININTIYPKIGLAFGYY